MQGPVFRSLLLMATVLALSWSAAPSVAFADEPVRLGPLPQRVRNPLYTMHLQPGPRRARVLDPGVMEFDVQVDWANVWEKWSRRVESGVQRQDVDMELVRTAFTGRIGLPHGVELAVEVPLLTLSGGITDGAIQAWHRLLKAENGGRDWVRDDRYRYQLFVPWKVDYEVVRPTVMALGDITAEAHVQFLRPTAIVPGLSGRFFAKLPTGQVSKGVGSGAPDLAATVHFEHGWRRVAFYAMAGAILFGREGELGPILRQGSITWSAALELGIGPFVSVIGQLHGATVFHEGFVHRFLNRTPIGVTVGTKVRLGPMDLGFGMEQDIMNGDPAADITLVFDAAFRVGESPAARRGSVL